MLDVYEVQITKVENGFYLVVRWKGDEGTDMKLLVAKDYEEVVELLNGFAWNHAGSDATIP